MPTYIYAEDKLVLHKRMLYKFTMYIDTSYILDNAIHLNFLFRVQKCKIE